MREGPKGETVEAPRSSPKCGVLAATLARDHVYPHPGSAERYDRKEELSYSSYPPLVTSDILGQGTGSVGSQSPIVDSEQNCELKKQNVYSQSVNISQDKVLRLKGGAGDEENHETGCPHTYVISFHDFCLQEHLFTWIKNHL